MDNYQTLKVRLQAPVCFIQIHRPEANNTINDLLIEECLDAINRYEPESSIVVFEGLPEVFCFGADFQGIHDKMAAGGDMQQDPGPLYELWSKIATGPFISIAHVRGKANAGGIGFVAACDIVLADPTAEFSLSELLFGLFPACVLPFLIRRVGFQKAHYLTLSTKPFTCEEAIAAGLVDACEDNSSALLRKHLLRLRHIKKNAVAHYKSYMNDLNGLVEQSRPLALEANRQIFSDSENLQGIYRYIETGQFPWES